MSHSPNNHSQGYYQSMLPARLTEGIVVRRVCGDAESSIATNVPPLRHASPSGFDFGNDGPGAQDLSLACVQAILERMDYIGPTKRAWDGSRVFMLAQKLQEPFLTRFIVPAQGDELRISWNQALGWTRRALLDQLRKQGLNTDRLFNTWRRSVDALPHPPPQNELDRADATRRLRSELLDLTGDASILAQFLGMIG